ncbi:DUF4288 domain-containing protein [Paenibacillus sp. HWE-109]|uniref:DUF4288 domain-containing protein n=1 Tax=Paenibacillus sp. HWE-109 TaxID=1306526 RepID=UPI001EDF257F|nr:DUF4288 domain-containing protein [Paenibacillus sp. HWE-109]UKS29657.1 DUF4288 domain-containing protein [Paenibacillus sp. HWE-109]
MRKRIKSRKESNWKWYGVKLLFESVLSGEPIPEKIDESYLNTQKLYEEMIMLLKDKSLEQAYKQGESTGKQSEHSYFNGYGEQVEWKFIMVLDVFELLDDVIKSGVEVYSRFIHSTKYISTDDVIQQYYPESIVKDDE